MIIVDYSADDSRATFSLVEPSLYLSRNDILLNIIFLLGCQLEKTIWSKELTTHIEAFAS